MSTSSQHKNRRQFIRGTAAALGAASFAPGLLAQSTPVRVGYAIARTGPWTGGAQVSQTTCCGPSSRTPPAGWT